MRLGILGTADIAYRRFLPALKSSDLEYAGVASRTPEKGLRFQETYGGKVYDSYDALLEDETIDAVYVPLPPGLHAQWGAKVLDAGKHLFLEKPFTTSYADTKRLLQQAKAKGLIAFENYMFLHHSQFATLRKWIDSGELGILRQVRTSFTFPFRGENDFRYDAHLGGGALFDCGGYPLLLASELLGESIELCWAGAYFDEKYGIDTGGSAVFRNKDGITAHIFYGIDDTYRCEVELWGNKSSLKTDRIFTAPDNLAPVFHLNSTEGSRELQLQADDQVKNSLKYFSELFDHSEEHERNNQRILRQSQLIDQMSQLFTTKKGERTNEKN